MEHVVFYPSAEGGSAFKRVNSLEEAVSFVEHLRNSENITDFSVHTLTPVPLAFRAYYHVEVPAGDAAAGPAEAAEAAPEPVAEEPVAEEPVAAPVAAVDAAPAEAKDAADAPVAEAAPFAFEVPTQADAPEAVSIEEVATAAVDPVDEDRSEAWVAEAAAVEPPVEAAPPAPPAQFEEPAAAGPFAEAPPVTPQGSEDVVPVPGGKRSMGFFAR